MMTKSTTTPQPPRNRLTALELGSIRSWIANAGHSLARFQNSAAKACLRDKDKVLGLVEELMMSATQARAGSFAPITLRRYFLINKDSGRLYGDRVGLTEEITTLRPGGMAPADQDPEELWNELSYLMDLETATNHKAASRSPLELEACTITIECSAVESVQERLHAILHTLSPDDLKVVARSLRPEIVEQMQATGAIVPEDLTDSKKPNTVPQAKAYPPKAKGSKSASKVAPTTRAASDYDDPDGGDGDDGDD